MGANTKWKAKKRRLCEVRTCWRWAEVAGFCRPCYQGIERLANKSAGEIAYYLKRVSTFKERALRMGRKK